MPDHPIPDGSGRQGTIPPLCCMRRALLAWSRPRIGQLHELVGAHSSEDVGEPRGRSGSRLTGPLIAALIAAGYVVHSLQASGYR